jgi:hypothetical protein
MASTFSNVADNIASIVSGSEIRSVDDEFTTLKLPNVVLPDWFGTGPAIKLGTSQKYEVVVDRAIPRTITNTVNVVTADTTVTASTSDAQIPQIGTLLLADSEVMRVTAVATSSTSVTFTVTKGYGGTTSTTHTTSSTIQVMSPVFAEGGTFQQSTTLRGEFITFYPALIQYMYEESGIRASERTYLEKNMDALDFDTKVRHQERVKADFERLLLHAPQSIISSSLSGSFKGVRGQIASNISSSVGTLTATNIEDMLDLIYAWDGTQNVTVLGNRKMHRIWSAVFNQYFEREGEVTTDSVGVKVWNYASALGDLKYMVVDACLDGELLFLRKDDIKIHPLDMGAFGTGWQQFERGPQQTNAVSRQVCFYWAGTVVLKDERRHGKLTGITSTVSSYAGAV